MKLTIPIDCGSVGEGSAMKRFLQWADWVSPFPWIAWLVAKGADGLSKDYRDDPVYKKNVQRMIDRNRKFQDAKE